MEHTNQEHLTVSEVPGNLDCFATVNIGPLPSKDEGGDIEIKLRSVSNQKRNDFVWNQLTIFTPIMTVFLRASLIITKSTID